MSFRYILFRGRKFRSHIILKILFFMKKLIKKVLLVDSWLTVGIFNKHLYSNRKQAGHVLHQICLDPLPLFISQLLSNYRITNKQHFRYNFIKVYINVKLTSCVTRWRYISFNPNEKSLQRVHLALFCQLFDKILRKKPRECHFLVILSVI